MAVESKLEHCHLHPFLERKSKIELMGNVVYLGHFYGLLVFGHKQLCRELPLCFQSSAGASLRWGCPAGGHWMSKNGCHPQEVTLLFCHLFLDCCTLKVENCVRNL